MKRYTNWCALTHKHDMLEHENGAWVRYDEAADEIARLRHDLSKAMMNHNADLNAQQSETIPPQMLEILDLIEKCATVAESPLQVQYRMGTTTIAGSSRHADAIRALKGKTPAAKEKAK